VHRSLAFSAALASAALLGGEAAAAPPWVDRTLTLPSGDWAFDVSLGIGHVPAPTDNTGAGVNLEMAVGITDRIELGVRTGLRVGDEPNRGIEADGYGRLFDRQYFDGRDGIVANPEVRITGAIVRTSIVELGVEGRLIVPIEGGSNAGLEPGLPIRFHLGDAVRLDTGVWVPIVVGNPSALGISLPLDVWIQVARRVWLGPMTGLGVYNVSGQASNTYVSLGFGLGYQISRIVDFKTMFLFPALNDDSRLFGLGAGVQIRIE
jgi:hypothetical protein